MHLNGAQEKKVFHFQRTYAVPFRGGGEIATHLFYNIMAIILPLS